MQKIVNVGGIVKSSVSSKTDYLVVGKQDKALVGDDGLSSKEEKAYELISSGSSIKILNEEQFSLLLG
jgi:DNA polymerase-3 subunit epsilon